jgi:hypothetical protein
MVSLVQSVWLWFWFMTGELATARAAAAAGTIMVNRKSSPHLKISCTVNEYIVSESGD